MEETNILSVLAHGGDGFSKRQKNVARYICENCDKAAFMTASMLSEAANVSESTVVRFAVQLGFSNYPEMRRAMQQVLRGRLTLLRGMDQEENGGSSAEILQRSLAESAESLRRFVNDSNERSFESILGVIKNSGHIYIVGVDEMTSLAEYFAARLDLMHGCVYAYGTDTLFRLQNIAEGDLLICIGAAKYCAAAMMLAKDKGAETALIFDGHTLQAAKYADHVMLAESAVTVVACFEAFLAAISIEEGKIEETLRQETEKLLAEYEEHEY